MTLTSIICNGAFLNQAYARGFQIYESVPPSFLLPITLSIRWEERPVLNGQQ